MQALVLLSLLLAAAPSLAQAANETLAFDSGTLVFAIIGDWGRIGGEYSDGTLATCKAQAAAFIANPDMPAGDDPEGNACGGLEQLKVAALMDKVCKERGCQFVANTGDNFYVNGCYADDNMDVNATLRCANRFKTDWENVYNKDTESLGDLPWINSLGNHDVLGLASGVDAQIAYQQKNPNWILPARWFNADVHGNETSIRFHVAHTSCFVAKYRTNDSDYYTDELVSCSSEASVADQMAFLKDSMETSDADWDVVIAHHPALSSAGPSYFDPSQATPTADGWTPLADLVAEYKPVAYLNGHDHTMSFQYAADAGMSGDTNISRGYPATGFHTSGAGSWPQAADGGFGLDHPYSFVKYANVDWLTGYARSGFAIATVTSDTFVVDYYSNGQTVPLRVTTKKGGPPVWQFAPDGVDTYKLPSEIRMNSDGEWVQFRRLKHSLA